jgi:hypothetical protein
VLTDADDIGMHFSLHLSIHMGCILFYGKFEIGLFISISRNGAALDKKKQRFKTDQFLKKSTISDSDIQVLSAGVD